MLKKITTLFIAVIIIFGITSSFACSDKKSKESNASPFDFKSNIIETEIKIDGIDDDELWKDENAVKIEYAQTQVTIVRKPNAIYLFYKTYDASPYSYIGKGSDDEVTHSDSIEFYVDSKINRADSPIGNCYQINLGRDGRTRIMSGAEGVFYKWIALYSFEVREGVNEDYDYYFTEVALPVNQMNMGSDECVAVAFGLVDRVSNSNVDLEKNFLWRGYEYTDGGQTVAVDPLIPSTYLILSPKSLEEGQPNRLYTYSEYLALKGAE